MAEMNTEETPFATLRTEVTVKRSHFAFLYAAVRHAGWDVDEDVEGITTDEGYDHEIRMRLKVRVPLSVLAGAPDLNDLETDGIEKALRDLSVLA